MKFNEYTTTAVEAAKAGGQVLMKYFNAGLRVEYKGRIDPVTAADRASQREIAKIISKAFPGHSIVGEEDRGKTACTGRCWIIDPLDGTVNFIHGVPFFSISIGFLHDGSPECGVIHSPRTGETFVAQRGKGAFLNGNRIRVTAQGSLVRSLVVTGFPYDVRRGKAKVIRSLSNVLSRVQGVRRLGSAALDLAYVASGRFEAFWEKGLKPWDVAAGVLLVEEAGGRVSEYDGSHNHIFGGNILASNGKIHSRMIKLIE